VAKVLAYGAGGPEFALRIPVTLTSHLLARRRAAAFVKSDYNVSGAGAVPEFPGGKLSPRPLIRICP